MIETITKYQQYSLKKVTLNSTQFWFDVQKIALAQGFCTDSIEIAVLGNNSISKGLFVEEKLLHAAVIKKKSYNQNTFLWSSLACRCIDISLAL